MNNGKRIDFYIGRYLGVRVDVCERVNHAVILSFAFYNLSNHICFRHNFIADESGSAHFHQASADGAEQLHFQYHGISGDHFLLELAVIDLEEVSVVIFGIRLGVEGKDAAYYLARASQISTPGITGLLGKCPWKICSLNVTFLMPTTCWSLSSMILSTSSIG